MNAELVRREANPPTLHEAAQLLREAADAVAGPGWLAAALSAARKAMVAVESELGALSAVDGPGRQVFTEEPRLLPTLHHLQEQLAQLLVDLWEADRMVTSEAAASEGKELVALAARMRKAADDSFELVHEAMVNTPALD